MTYQAPKTLQPTPELGAKPEELPPSYSTLIVDQMPMHVFLPIVYFKDNTWELTDESRQELDELVKTMAKQKGMRISIRGHTDSDGNDAVNHTLSRRRAAFVAHYLQSKGIQAGRMQTAAFGASMPIADNTTKEGKQLNRRVDFEIIE
jgi:outer membrane protein OmpA-like peptidoglycan-associated protein